MLTKSFDKQKRINIPVSFEVKAIDDSEGIIKGYASVFDVVDSYGTVIKHGAFKESIDKKGTSGIRVLFNHNWDEVIGVPLVIREDQTGLYVEFKVIQGVQRAEEVFKLVKAGAIDAFSIGFVVQNDEFDRENDVINITKLDLWEFSPVTFPANQLALVTDVRSAVSETEEETVEDVENNVFLNEIKELNQGLALKATLQAINNKFS